MNALSVAYQTMPLPSTFVTELQTQFTRAYRRR